MFNISWGPQQPREGNYQLGHSPMLHGGIAELPNAATAPDLESHPRGEIRARCAGGKCDHTDCPRVDKEVIVPRYHTTYVESNKGQVIKYLPT